ncbi:MAG: MFS transporter, partial [Anaerolineales bacterium]|nr:MFS transporter [Anaerolineales bacterium]
LAVLILAIGAREVHQTKPSAAPLLSLKGMDARFKTFLVIVVLFTLGNSSDSFIILRGQERGLNVFQIMLMAMTFNFIYAVFAGPLGALSDKIGRRRIILFGWLAYGLVYLGFAFSRT